MKIKCTTKTVENRRKKHPAKKPIDPTIYDINKHCLAVGHPKIGGRAKGTKNKFTTLKDAFINAFQRIGGEDALVKYCTPEKIEVIGKKGKVRIIDLSPERQKEFFKMIVPMLPKEVAVTGADGAPLPSQVPVIIFQDAPKENESDDKK